MTNEQIRIRTDRTDGVVVLTVEGILDGTTYRTLRDTIIKAALDEPRAVIVDITVLTVPSESALAVFTSARWHIVRWPNVPLLLACRTDRGRKMLRRNGITRYVEVYPDVLDAITALSGQPMPGRLRVRAELTSDWSSVGRSRDVVTDWLQAWCKPDLQSVAKVVVSALVENAVVHSDGPTGLRLESSGDEFTIAVEDPSTAPASFREDILGADAISSLKIVDALCRAWGCSPTAAGKVVWCVIGPENQL